jgi:uncharacterized membrane protein YqaE (UPF0057 family)
MRKAIFLLLALFMLASVSTVTATTRPTRPLTEEPDPVKIRAAIEEFKRLPRKEKKERIKHFRKELKNLRAAKKRGEEVDTNTVLLVLLAIILPPVAVYLHEGTTNTKFWITLLLTVLGITGFFIFGWYAYLAAVIYALIIVLGGA